MTVMIADAYPPNYDTGLTFVGTPVYTSNRCSVLELRYATRIYRFLSGKSSQLNTGTLKMKIICLCFISFALSSVALTDGRFHKSKQDQSAVYKDEMEKELWQVMSAENEEYIDDDEDETKVYSFHPTKHPYKVRDD